MTPFTPDELKNEIQKLILDKLPAPSGMTKRMLQASDTDFQGHILIFFKGPWEFHTQNSNWQLFLLQPIYKGHNKDKTDPVSYKGVYLSDTLAKLFEGLLIARLTTHTELIFSFRHYSAQQIYPTKTHLCSFYRIFYRLPLRSSRWPLVYPTQEWYSRQHVALSPG